MKSIRIAKAATLLFALSFVARSLQAAEVNGGNEAQEKAMVVMLHYYYPARKGSGSLTLEATGVPLKTTVGELKGFAARCMVVHYFHSRHGKSIEYSPERADNSIALRIKKQKGLLVFCYKAPASQLSDRELYEKVVKKDDKVVMEDTELLTNYCSSGTDDLNILLFEMVDKQL